MVAKLVLSLLGACLLAAFQPAQAQQPPKLAKIGELLFRPGVTLGAGREVFRQSLRELGYVEGKSLVYESRSAEGKLERFPAVTDELIRLKVDLLLASSTTEALAFKKATRTIPVVFIVSSDPVADGLVDSLARPGENLTGVTTIASTLAGKRLELLKETVPNLSRVAVLWNPRDPGSVQQWNESQLAARELKLQLHSIELSSPEKIATAFQEAVKAGSRALAEMSTSVASANRKVIADLAVKHHLPAIFDRQDFVTSGGLMSYGADRAASYKRAAVMVDKVLRGTKPADIPVEQPMKFEFVVNLKTAKQIGLTIPPNVLVRANKVIR